MVPESFVSAEKAAEFMGINRRHLLARARRGMAGAYPLDPQAKRKRWVFRLSELTFAIAKTVIHNSDEVCDPASDLGGPR